MRAHHSLEAAAATLRVVIAIPARDEADRIGGCLDALAAQRARDGGPFDYAGVGVLVLANCCRDDTAARVRAQAPALPFPVIALEAELPPGQAHAGGARRLALETAASLVADDRAALLTTDADARPGPGWLAANLAGLAAGVDAVAGRPVPDATEFAALPGRLRRRETRENRYAGWLDALGAALDPEPHDPWPRHNCAAGASIAITRGALARVGGVPPIPTGEDRALLAAVAAAGGRIRHCPAAIVSVSCRLEGRAGGGMAATLRRREHDPAAPVDGRLEPALDAFRRGRARAALRRLRVTHDPAAAARLARWAGLDAAGLSAILALPEAAGLAELDATPGLVPRPVAPQALRLQTALAAALVATARISAALGRVVASLRSLDRSYPTRRFVDPSQA